MKSIPQTHLLLIKNHSYFRSQYIATCFTLFDTNSICTYADIPLVHL